MLFLGRSEVAEAYSCKEAELYLNSLLLFLEE